MGGGSSHPLYRSEDENSRKLRRKEGQSESEYDYSDHIYTDINDGHPAYQKIEKELKKARRRRTRSYYRSKGYEVPRGLQNFSDTDEENVVTTTTASKKTKKKRKHKMEHVGKQTNTGTNDGNENSIPIPTVPQSTDGPVLEYDPIPLSPAQRVLYNSPMGRRFRALVDSRRAEALANHPKSVTDPSTPMNIPAKSDSTNETPQHDFSAEQQQSSNRHRGSQNKEPCESDPPIRSRSKPTLSEEKKQPGSKFSKKGMEPPGRPPSFDYHKIAGTPKSESRWWQEGDEANKRRREKEEFGFDRGSYGRSSNHPPYRSFIVDEWIRDYLGGPIKRYKMPTNFTDKVEIEPIPGLGGLVPYRPILSRKLEGGKWVTIKHVFGLRELGKKRDRIRALKFRERESAWRLYNGIPERFPESETEAEVTALTKPIPAHTDKNSNWLESLICDCCNCLSRRRRRLYPGLFSNVGDSCPCCEFYVFEHLSKTELKELERKLWENEAGFGVKDLDEWEDVSQSVTHIDTKAVELPSSVDHLPEQDSQETDSTTIQIYRDTSDSIPIKPPHVIIDMEKHESYALNMHAMCGLAVGGGKKKSHKHDSASRSSGSSVSGNTKRKEKEAKSKVKKKRQTSSSSSSSSSDSSSGSSRSGRKNRRRSSGSTVINIHHLVVSNKKRRKHRRRRRRSFSSKSSKESKDRRSGRSKKAPVSLDEISSLIRTEIRRSIVGAASIKERNRSRTRSKSRERSRHRDKSSQRQRRDSPETTPRKKKEPAENLSKSKTQKTDSPTTIKSQKKSSLAGSDSGTPKMAKKKTSPTTKPAAKDSEPGPSKVARKKVSPTTTSEAAGSSASGTPKVVKKKASPTTKPGEGDSGEPKASTKKTSQISKSKVAESATKSDTTKTVVKKKSPSSPSKSASPVESKLDGQKNKDVSSPKTLPSPRVAQPIKLKKAGVEPKRGPLKAKPDTVTVTETGDVEVREPGANTAAEGSTGTKASRVKKRRKKAATDAEEGEPLKSALSHHPATASASHKSVSFVPSGSEASDGEEARKHRRLRTKKVHSAPVFGEKEKYQESETNTEDQEDGIHKWPKQIESDTAIPNRKAKMLRREKDNEWLLLSTSDSEEEILRSQTLEKPKKPGMKESISYESQELTNTLKPYMLGLTLAARQPFQIKTDENLGMVQFCISRRRQILFAITTLILWLTSVFVVLALGEIASDKSNVNYENDQLENIYLFVEAIEMKKFAISLSDILVNLFLAAIWSVSILLKDGLNICQYLNFMVASLTNMETSALVGIKKLTILNYVAFVVYTVVMCICFYFDFPRTVRGTAGFLSMLVFRPFSYQLRIRSDEEMLYFQIFGLCLQIYIIFSSRVILAFLQIVSRIIKNTAEWWNFRFLLTFEQCGAEERGHLLRLKMSQSLIKTFVHHRLVNGLVRQFGSVFSISIMTYFLCQLAALTIILVQIFFYAQETPEAYGGNDTFRHEGLTLRFYNSYSDERLSSYFVLFHVFLNFVTTSECISAAGVAVMDGCSFVRRVGLIRSKSSHERRLIQSLLWSFSPTNPAMVNVNHFFMVNREAIVGALGTVLVFVSLIIQLAQTEDTDLVVKVPCPNSTHLYAENYSQIHWCYRVTSVPEGDVNRTIQEYRDRNNDRKTTTESAQVQVYLFWDDCLTSAPDPCISKKWDNSWIQDVGNPSLTTFVNGTFTWPVCTAKVERTDLSKIPPRYMTEEEFFEVLAYWTKKDYAQPSYFTGNCLRDPALNEKTASAFDWKALMKDYYFPCESQALNMKILLQQVRFCLDDCPFVDLKELRMVQSGSSTGKLEDKDCGLNPYPELKDLDTDEPLYYYNDKGNIKNKVDYDGLAASLKSPYKPALEYYNCKEDDIGVPDGCHWYSNLQTMVFDTYTFFPPDKNRQCIHPQPSHPGTSITCLNDHIDRCKIPAVQDYCAAQVRIRRAYYYGDLCHDPMNPERADVTVIATSTSPFPLHPTSYTPATTPEDYAADVKMNEGLKNLFVCRLTDQMKQLIDSSCTLHSEKEIKEAKKFWECGRPDACYKTNTLVSSAVACTTRTTVVPTGPCQPMDDDFIRAKFLRRPCGNATDPRWALIQQVFTITPDAVYSLKDDWEGNCRSTPYKRVAENPTAYRLCDGNGNLVPLNPTDFDACDWLTQYQYERKPNRVVSPRINVTVTIIYNSQPIDVTRSCFDEPLALDRCRDPDIVCRTDANFIPTTWYWLWDDCDALDRVRGMFGLGSGLDFKDTISLLPSGVFCSLEGTQAKLQQVATPGFAFELDRHMNQTEYDYTMSKWSRPSYQPPSGAVDCQNANWKERIADYYFPCKKTNVPWIVHQQLRYDVASNPNHVLPFMDSSIMDCETDPYYIDPVVVGSATIYSCLGQATEHIVGQHADAKLETFYLLPFLLTPLPPVVRDPCGWPIGLPDFWVKYTSGGTRNQDYSIYTPTKTPPYLYNPFLPYYSVYDFAIDNYQHLQTICLPNRVNRERCTDLKNTGVFPLTHRCL